jgi:hypothetical protein
MYKDTFLMINGDTFVDGDLVMVGGQEELRQNIENRLSVNIGEWFLNIKMGLDYAAITGKGVTDEEIDFAIRECCLQDERVKEVKNIKIFRDAKQRTANIDILIIDKGEEELWLKEVVDLG